MAQPRALAGEQDRGREGWAVGPGMGKVQVANAQAPRQGLGLSLWARDEGQSLEEGV